MVGDPVLSYTDGVDHPGEQDAYCTYHMSDGTTQVRWVGRRAPNGHLELECADF